MNVNSKNYICTHSGHAIKSFALLAICTVTTLGLSSAAAAPILSSDLASFAVLGATGVTNVPTSTIGGNLGSAPNGSIGGGYVFTSGSLQSNTSLAQQAQLDLDAAFVALSNFGNGISIIDGNLDTYQAAHGGKIDPGTYSLGAAPTNLTGDLFLDGAGDSKAVWVFQFGSTLITSSNSNVFVKNVGSGDKVGVYWNVGSAATINGNTFAGNVLARELISSDGNLTINCGRLLSGNSQVTLIQDRVSITGCEGLTGASGGYDQGAAIGSGGTGGSNGQVVSPVPEPATFGLLGLGLLGLTASRRKSMRK